MEDKDKYSLNFDKLTEAQKEILKLFAFEMNDDEIKELKKVLLKFRFKLLGKAVDDYLTRNGLTHEDVLKMHLRSPYK